MVAARLVVGAMVVRAAVGAPEAPRVNVSVAWHAPFYSGGGYCSEATTFVVALGQMGVPISIEPHSTRTRGSTTWKGYRKCSRGKKAWIYGARGGGLGGRVGRDQKLIISSWPRAMLSYDISFIFQYRQAGSVRKCWSISALSSN